ncbi:MAG: hypothetical protein KDB18_10910 [Salinibacterium sp.]|nr:hypothetical protein [Salinibacterium sp.]
MLPVTAASAAPSLGPELRLEPPTGSWPALSNRALNNDRAKATRAALGLSPDRSIVISGHQPTLWHPGILSKRFALTAHARSHGAQPVWLVVDQDAVDAWSLDIPISAGDGSLSQSVLRLAPPPAEASPACAQRTVIPSTTGADGLSAVLRDRIDRAISALAAGRHEPSAAKQVERATSSWLSDTTPTVYASELHRLPVFDRLLSAMADDAASCARAYNHAVRAHGGARPLECRGENDWELPLWEINSVRSPV